MNPASNERPITVWEKLMSITLPTSKSFKNLTGQRFSRLVVVSYAGREGKYKHTMWNVSCDCGNTKTVRAGHLLHGKIVSCGCLQKEIPAKRFRTHGKRLSDEYRIWEGMKQRCTNSGVPHFHLYGGRGITVCERWLESFENFHADMGDRPSKSHQIERVDNNGNYEKSNCVWATRKQQSRNRRSNRFLTYAGMTKTIAEWSEICGVRPYLISQRLNRDGASVEEALGYSKTV